MKIALNFETLRKEVLSLIPNFSKINQLPSFKDFKIKDCSHNFMSENVNIKNLTIFILTLFLDLLKQ